MNLRNFVAVVLALACTACATVNSNARRADSSADRGIPYYLPKALLRTQIVLTSDDEVRVVLAGPIIVGDPNFLLHADLRHGAFSDDATTVKVDPETSLLTSVDVKSTGRAAELIENAAKFFGMLQAAEGQGGQVIFSGLYGFDDLPRASADASYALNRYFDRRCGRFGALKDANLSSLKRSLDIGDNQSKALEEELNRCRKLKLDGIDMANLVEIALVAGENLPAPLASIDQAACRKGLCYRPMRPVAVTATIASAYRTTEVFLMPDRSRLSYFGLTAGAFADQRYKLTFDQGALVEATSDTKSELVGFSTLPLKVVSAVVSAPATALGLRSAAMKSEDSYLQALDEHNAQIEKSRASCKNTPELCSNTALKILKIDLGKPRSATGDHGAVDSRPPGNNGVGDGTNGPAGTDGTISTGDD